jgi:hypothetical protein
MVGADWLARVGVVVAIVLGIASFSLAYAQHQRDRARRSDEERSRDSARLRWFTDPPKSMEVGLFVENSGADAYQLHVKLERGARGTLHFDVPVVPNGSTVRCGKVDISFPPGQIDWSITATWHDSREGEQVGVWPLRHIGP